MWSPHDLKHRRISVLHAQGKSWAQIAEQVGNRSAKVLSDTYTHVLMDERELDYEALIAELLEDESTRAVLALSSPGRVERARGR